MARFYTYARNDEDDHFRQLQPNDRNLDPPDITRLEHEKKVSNILETKKVRSVNSPWITKNIRQEMRHRDFLKKKAIQTKSKHYHQAYKRERNELNKQIKTTKV